MQPGDEWVYRLRDSAPSERVRILEMRRKGHWVRATVEFLGDNGRTEDVPGARLRAPWAEVAEFNELMADWARIDREEITETESYAADMVMRMLVPRDVATPEWSPVRYALAVYQSASLENLMGSALGAIQENVEWFQHGGVTMLSPEGMVQVAAALCRANAPGVLADVLEDEERIRIECATGYTGKMRKGEPVFTEPDWSWESYLEIDRPIHELLRQWCGHRAVSAQERLEASEQEVHRLDRLLDRALQNLETRAPAHIAKALRHEHTRERITPTSVRPVVAPKAEPEVHFVPTRRGRWWG